MNRVEVEVRGWSRGEIELTVDGEGSDELTDDRANRFVRGLEAALVAARAASSRTASAGGRHAQPDPAGARPGVIGGGHGRRRAGGQ